jgi:hypothetical protein
MARAKKILPILELSDFKCLDIAMIERQEEEIMKAIFALKAVGNKIEMQAKKRKLAAENG